MIIRLGLRNIDLPSSYDIFCMLQRCRVENACGKSNTSVEPSSGFVGPLIPNRYRLE
jgi:hypothetical protein